MWLRVSPKTWASNTSASTRGEARPVSCSAASARQSAILLCCNEYMGSQRRASIAECGELLGLVLIDERVDDVVEIALDDIFQFIQGEVDAVVGEAALWKIVGADALRTVAAAHLKTPGLRLLRRLFFALGGEQLGLQQ